ncbi:Netrin receptor DCC like protein [Argiope bruennichi]|uniref:Netrin receptor DCC like protein n=1 Tax=Argiope bruennichi TaxID=94029 RepID=A0A8T0FXL0_ARGBR|nr:Netrin receptor DCC like protein [Argiope bruennichi]
MAFDLVRQYKENQNSEPVIVMGPSNTTAMMGDIVVFTCDTIGDPPPQITWQRNGRNIYINGHSSYKILDSGSLQLDNVGPADYGMYHCSAKNDKGVASSETAHLQVEVPAKVCEKDHSTKDLDCAVYGEKEKKNPPIQQFCFLIPFFLMYQRELRDWGLRQTQYAFDLTYGDLREDFRSELRGSSPRKRPGGKKSIRSISSLSHTTTTQEYVWAGKDLSQKTYETL